MFGLPYYDHNHSVSLWLSWIGKIRQCNLYFALLLPRCFDQRCFTGRVRKGVLRAGTARVFHGAGPQGCFAGRGVHLCPLAPLKVPVVKSSWRIFIFCTNIVLQVCPRWSSTLLYYISLSVDQYRAEVSESSRSREFSTRVSFIFSRSTTRTDFLQSRSRLETWE